MPGQVWGDGLIDAHNRGQTRAQAGFSNSVNCRARRFGMPIVRRAKAATIFRPHSIPTKAVELVIGDLHVPAR